MPARKIQRLDIRITCTQCGREVRAVLHIDNVTIVDSDGGVLFGNGFTCNNCLGEPWSSSDVTI